MVGRTLVQISFLGCVFLFPISRGLRNCRQTVAYAMSWEPVTLRFGPFQFYLHPSAVPQAPGDGKEQFSEGNEGKSWDRVEDWSL